MSTEGTYVETPSVDSRHRTRYTIAIHVAVGTGLAALLFLFAGNAGIPPLVESDYCYLLTAADRFADGKGLTATQPVAPLQPWEWQRDWSFLTKWPCGYPMMIAVAKIFTGDTLVACRLVAAIACAAACIGWFLWARRCTPQGMPGILLAVLTASCSISLAGVMNPSTDQLLIAAIPYILLLVIEGIGEKQQGPPRIGGAPYFGYLIAAGLLSGMLFWIRYASIFVPAAVAFFLVLIAFSRRRTAYFRSLQAFCFSALAPIVILVSMNRALGAGASTQEQLNLGHSVGFHLSLNMLATAWMNLTEYSFYAHKPAARWLFACWPAILAMICLGIPQFRQTMLSHFRRPAVMLSASMVFMLLLVLTLVTTLFAAKFNYIALDRYYQPVKPIYFLLFVAPLIALPWKPARWMVAVCAGLGISWFAQHEWPKTYQRWIAAEREVTPYGQWANCFSPNAAKVYSTVQALNAPTKVVISNFHEWIMLETGVPALPVPPDQATLDRWLRHIKRARNVRDLEVVFVLDRENRWRDYWIPEPTQVLEEFKLSPMANMIAHDETYILHMRPTVNRNMKVHAEPIMNRHEETSEGNESDARVVRSDTKP